MPKFALIMPCIIVCILWFTSAPTGLSVDAWHFMLIFSAVVVGLITQLAPAALLGLVGITVSASLNLVGNSSTENISWALSGFSNDMIWLIFAVYIIALGYKKTTLGKRATLVMIKYMGKSSLGLGYAVAFSDFLLAPFISSSTARSAGSIYPIASNIPLFLDSTSKNEPRKIGSYISWVAVCITCITSSMFLTAFAPNLLSINLISEATGNHITWTSWASVMIPLMMPLFLLTPYLVYIIYPPNEKILPFAPSWADEQLKELGNVTAKEYLMLFYITITLVFWTFSEFLGIHPTTTAFFTIILMILTNIISWNDLLSSKEAFNILLWFSSFLTLASGLIKTGVLKWFSNLLEPILLDMTPTHMILSIFILFFITHYFFASTTAHTIALMPIFLTIAMKFLTTEQIYPFSILLAGSLGLMGVLTPYATGSSVIWFQAGYISFSRWWVLGFVFGALYLSTIILGSFLYM